MSNPSPQISPVEQIPAANGWFQLDVPSNGKIAKVKKIVRHTGNGKPVTSKDILAKLKQLKVIHGIDLEAIDKLVKDVDENKIPEEPVAVAKGEVEDGENGTIEWLIEGLSEKNSNKYLVVPGTKIAIQKLATQGRRGKNVFGKPVNPRPGFDLQIKAGKGISSKQETDGEVVYESEVVGLLSNNDNELAIDNGFKVSEDKLNVYMNIYAGMPVNSEKQITIEDHLQTIKSAGIIHGVDEQLIASEFEKVKASGSIIENVLVAKGKEPVSGEDDHLEWKVNIEADDETERAVLPNQLIATHSANTHASAGVDVYGEVISGEEGEKLNVACGDGVIEIETNDCFEIRSTWLGVVKFESDMISVDPGINVSDDEMKVTMNIVRSNINSEKYDIFLSHIVSALNEYGVVYGIKNDAINLVLSNLNKEKKPKYNLLVAQGIPVKNGVDTKIIYEEHFSASGQLLPNGQIDYQEKSYPWNVKPGDVIGKVVPGIRAEDGKNVKGEVIHAEAVKETKPELDGVRLEKNGTLRVTRDGVLLVNNINFTVSDTLELNGDVCQKTGNIHSDKPVNVRGFVEPGFVLETKGDAIIQNNVEDATVEAQGSIIIKSGIRGTHSKIIAGGDITASFAENADLNAKGDIIVKNSLINCHAVCQGKIKVGSPTSRKSALVGDVTQAFGGVEVAVLGSDSFNKTIIEAGAGPESLKHLRELAEEISNVKKGISDLNKLYVYYCKNPKSQKEQNELLLKLNGTRDTKNKEYEDLLQEDEELKKLIEESKNVKVIVHKKVYPGVLIQMMNKIYEVKEERNAGIFLLKNDKIMFEPK